MILGISGKALSGKDTIADYLIMSGIFDEKDRYSKVLKQSCSEIFGFDLSYFYEQSGKSSELISPVIVDFSLIQRVVSCMAKTQKVNVNDKPYGHLIGKELRTFRDLLQFVGTDVMRYYKNDYHVVETLGRIDSTRNVVLPDVRFDNEAVGVLDVGGFLIRVERPFSLRVKYGRVNDSTHPSEVALDTFNKWSYIIENNSDNLKTLFLQIEGMVKFLGLDKNDNHNKKT